MYKTSQIRSIGWLYNTPGMITLTPCFDGCCLPLKVQISSPEFEALGGDRERMKQKAVDVLNNGVAS